MAQNTTPLGGTAIGERTIGYAGYATRKRKGKWVEEILGWFKTFVPMVESKLRDPERVGWMFTWTAA